MGQKVISKWGREGYMKKGNFRFKGWELIQIGAKFISNWGSYFKWGKMLFQSVAVISKWGNYFKVGHSINILTFQDTLI